jgi:NAD(P)-dependent dehydrogenase (short-subunit alcohol dehydrogenase family)
VNTPMINNEHTRAWLQRFVAESETPVDWGNAMPVDMVEAEDIAAAVAWLVSDEARYVTGITLPVDAGLANKR